MPSLGTNSANIRRSFAQSSSIWIATCTVPNCVQASPNHNTHAHTHAHTRTRAHTRAHTHARFTSARPYTVMHAYIPEHVSPTPNQSHTNHQRQGRRRRADSASGYMRGTPGRSTCRLTQGVGSDNYVVRACLQWSLDIFLYPLLSPSSTNKWQIVWLPSHADAHSSSFAPAHDFQHLQSRLRVLSAHARQLHGMRLGTRGLGRRGCDKVVIFYLLT